jgi:hypothetical protein
MIETNISNSFNYQKWITHLSFCLTSKKTIEEVLKMGELLDKILSSLQDSIIQYSEKHPEKILEFNSYLNILYKLIAYTRDIYHGKGERDLSYIMIIIWYRYFPDYAVNALKLFVSPDMKYSIGSWKDMKYFCKMVRDHSSLGTEDPLILDCIQIMNNQFNIDRYNINRPENISLVSKWIPRESSSFGWLYEKMVFDWSFSLSKKEKKLSWNQIKKKYRTQMSNINRILDTTQIKQCDRKWSKIIPENVSFITKKRQFHAFLNENSIYNNSEIETEIDRIECKEHFQDFYKKKESSFSQSLFMNLSLMEWMKEVTLFRRKPSNDLKEHLISTWTRINHSIPKFGNVIPILDLSMSNRDEILGLVFTIMEKSCLNDRILVYDSFPRWFSFKDSSSDSCPKILDKIDFFQSFIQDKGIGSNIYAMVDLIIHTCLTTKLSPLFIEDMVFILFTDYSFSLNEVHLEIMNRFQYSGILSPPHFIYWNTSSHVFETPFETYVNSTLFSGDSSSLLILLGQLFSDLDGREMINKNLHPIQKISTYELLCNTLNHPRYIPYHI